MYLVIQLEDAINQAFVFLTEKEYHLPIPFDEKRTSYSPKAFNGELHLLTARLATTEETAAYKNLAKNEYDHHGNTSLFPHASANVETRGEAVFAARNAINGNTVTYSHGGWPFESWGINQRDDAEFKVHFGRLVEIDKIVLYLRADFPHDNYWTNVTFTFSDDSKQTVELLKTGQAQSILLEPKKVEWITLGQMIKSDDSSPFPALTQFEVYGCEALDR
ncbi:hypothetical protein HPL003_21970 [Paenibacillus terrae HPL-003]|uniref:Carbohydrate-binding protein n=1 Tax=Paenibacillus terrae (strain HPL-003) TaxID=985665 RepID=G7VQ51_PAETH|nr:carbohydrate-binding protein [Paenibacillus terrae]AET61120.1 hypothetical protein HPL003_21970 [Paenibacillus terrae HPL-003]